MVRLVGRNESVSNDFASVTKSKENDNRSRLGVPSNSCTRFVNRVGWLRPRMMSNERRLGKNGMNLPVGERLRNGVLTD